MYGFSDQTETVKKLVEETLSNAEENLVKLSLNRLLENSKIVAFIINEDEGSDYLCQCVNYFYNQVSF